MGIGTAPEMPARRPTLMNADVVHLAILSVLGVAIREGGVTWRQLGALRSLERLADAHPESAKLVSRVVRPGRELPWAHRRGGGSP